MLRSRCKADYILKSPANLPLRLKAVRVTGHPCSRVKNSIPLHQDSMTNTVAQRLLWAGTQMASTIHRFVLQNNVFDHGCKVAMCAATCAVSHVSRCTMLVQQTLGKLGAEG
jgi:hypothetical protein